MNKNAHCENAASLSPKAVSPHVLCPNSTDGNIGNGENINADEMNDGNIEIPRDPTIPHTLTVEEYIRHKITHYPFKAWCPICVKNAAQNKPHYKSNHEREVESISMDYMFMTDKPTNIDAVHPILVIKARISGGVWALPVLRKGPYLTNIVKRVMNIINSIAAPRIIIKTDQEPAMKSMQFERNC